MKEHLESYLTDTGYHCLEIKSFKLCKSGINIEINQHPSGPYHVVIPEDLKEGLCLPYKDFIEFLMEKNQKLRDRIEEMYANLQKI